MVTCYGKRRAEDGPILCRQAIICTAFDLLYSKNICTTFESSAGGCTKRRIFMCYL
jgi:hypothetical protein